jgi:hypothetical protein
MELSQDVTNAKLWAKLEEIHSDVAETKAQTTKTNGRVTGLELREAAREGQLTIIKWAIGIISAIGTSVTAAYIISLIK